MKPRIVPQRGFNLDYLMWLFTRISGLMLVLLSLIGFFSAMAIVARTQVDLGTLIRWTFFPIQTHVVSYVDDVTAGWLNGFWQTMQMLIIFFGVTHGVNGLRMVLEDYMDDGWARILMRGFLLLLWLFVLFVSFSVIQANGPI